MFEYKFKNFDFRDFMDFVLNLVDYYGFGQIRFDPEKKEFFDDFQLKHISPSRTLDDKRGFVWAWKQKQDKVRKVSFDQFSNDNKRNINVSIDLNQKIIKLNKSEGISPVIIEELIKERFGSNYEVESDKLKELRMQIDILVFFSALIFSICFTLIFAIINIFKIQLYWGALAKYFVVFFGIAFFSIYIILPLINIVKMVGSNIGDIWLEFKAAFKRKSKLGKFTTVFSILAGIYLLYEIFSKIMVIF